MIPGTVFHMEKVAQFASMLPPLGALMGLDIGEKTTGIAISDRSRTVSSPLCQLQFPKLTHLIHALNPLMQEHRIVGIVIGFPLNMDGSCGPKAHSVGDKAIELARQLNCPGLLFDERLSTQAVERSMIDHDMTRKKRKKRKDQLAATYFLQTALNQISYHRPL